MRDAYAKNLARGHEGSLSALSQSPILELKIVATIFLHYENSSEKLPSIMFYAMM